MSKLMIAGVFVAVLIGITHGFLAAMWDLTVDQDTGIYPSNWVW